MGLEMGGDTEKEKEKEKEEEEEKIPLCGSIGHRPLRAAAQKGGDMYSELLGA